MAAASLTQLGLFAPRQVLTPTRQELKNITAGILPEPVRLPVAKFPLPPLPSVEVRESHGKGLGLFAFEPIPAFTCVAADYAVISLAHGENLQTLWEKYRLLPAELKAEFDQLKPAPGRLDEADPLISKLQSIGFDHRTASIATIVGFKFQANAFKNGDSGLLPGRDTLDLSGKQATESNRWVHSLFPTVARVNHSCMPNMHAHYRDSSAQQVLFSLRDIAPGEELELSYFDFTMPLKDRQKRSQDWGFKCCCSACSPIESFTSEEYSTQLALIHECVKDLLPIILRSEAADLQNRLTKIERAITYAEDGTYPWLCAALPRLYFNLAITGRQLNCPAEDIERANKSAYEWQLRLTGLSSPVLGYIDYTKESEPTQVPPKLNNLFELHEFNVDVAA